VNPSLRRALLRAAACLAFVTIAPGRCLGDDAPRTVPGEILVLLDRDAGVLSGASADASAASLGDLARASGVRARAVVPLSPGATPGARGFLVRLEDAADLAAAAAILSSEPGVAYAGPNHVLRFAATPNDPYFPQQRTLVDSRVPEAWDRSRGEGILIAVIDTGVDLDHPDLVDRLAVNAAERDGTAGVDDDGNGYVDDVFGYDFTDAPGLPGRGDYLDRDGDPQDDYGHGTQVAGTACATWNNAVGMAGVAPQAQVLAIRAGLLTTLPFLPAILEEDDAAAAILYAADRGAQVINLSWGDVVEAPVIDAAIRYAREKGALVIASAGNEGNDLAFYPASYPGVLAVGASTGRTRASFSTHGVDLDLLAPGVSVWTTTLGGGYAQAGGTSFSAPMTAGAAALVWSLNPSWTADQVATRLMLTAWRPGAAWSPEIGYGYLDAAAATEPAEPPPVARITGWRPLPPLFESPCAMYQVEGTVVHPRLQSWDLRAEWPDASQPIAEGQTKQLVNGVLSDACATRDDPFVLRLTAHVPGFPVLEDRVRGNVYGYPSRDEAVETVVEDPESWGILATWTSSLPHQGAVLVLPQDGFRRFADEATIGLHHAVRVSGIPGGIDAEVIPLSRGPDGAFYPATERRFHVGFPPVIDRLRASLGDVPAGTPFSRTVDLNGNDIPEVLVEAPPGAATYGPVRAYEWRQGSEFVRLGDSDDILGIPRAVGDSDGDGLLEIVVYRVDAWSVWEACAPGEFPACRVFSSSQGVPVAVIEGRGLLVVNGPRVQVLEAGSGYAQGPMVRHPQEVDFAAEAAVADVDGDGRLEAMLLDRNGALVQVELGSELVVENVSPGRGAPAGGPFLAGDAVLTAERDPDSIEFEGDLTRRVIRVRRWVRDGDGWVSPDSLAFAVGSGTTPARFHEGSETVVSRGGLLDALGPGLEWSGRLAEVENGEAAVVFPLPGLPGPVAWVGGPGGEPGKLVGWGHHPFGETTVGEMRVVEAVEDATGLSLTLEWLACPGGKLWRKSPGGDRVEIPTDGNRAEDYLTWGDEVVYVLETADCGDVTWPVRAAPVVVPRVSRDGGGLVVDLPVPLAAGVPLPEFSTRTDVVVPVHASLVDIEDGGRRIRLGFPRPDPGGVIIENGWTADGLPIGGSTRWGIDLPPRDAPPVIVSVRYEAEAKELWVTLQGPLPEPACPGAFSLEPEGLSPPYEATGTVAVLTLSTSLAGGVHTVSLNPACFPDYPSLGASRDFLVGVSVYPNPVTGDGPLTLANLPGPGRVTLHDLRGDELRSWEVPAGTSRLSLNVAPGLYMLRIESDKQVSIQKIAVRR